MKRNSIIILIVIVAIALIFVVPTPHVRAKEVLVKTFDCSTTLQDGYYITQGWVDLKDKTKVVIDIQSSQSVDVSVKSGTLPVYSQSGAVHAYSFTTSLTSFVFTVTNPTWLGTGPSAVITGDIKGYHIYNETVWLIWWMP